MFNGLPFHLPAQSYTLWEPSITYQPLTRRSPIHKEVTTFLSTSVSRPFGGLECPPFLVASESDTLKCKSLLTRRREDCAWSSPGCWRTCLASEQPVSVYITYNNDLVYFTPKSSWSCSPSRTLLTCLSIVWYC